MSISIPSFLRNRNAFLFGALIGAAGAGLYVYARRIEPRRYKLETVRVITGDGNVWRNRGGNGGSKKYEDKLSRRVFKILHISDLHLKRPESHKIEFLKRITDAEYDLVLLTGDVFEDLTGIEYASSILSRPPKIGAFAVLGNHDYYEYTMFNKTVGRVIRKLRQPYQKRDVTPLVEALEDAGFQVLRNESRTLSDHGIHLIGIDYPGIKEEDLAELVQSAPENHLLMAIFHYPKNLDFITRQGIQLAFGGHTHGGQVRIPGFGAVITDSELPRHQASGLIRRGETAFHISRGLGADPRTNFRFFCPPAATVVEVHHQTPVWR